MTTALASIVFTLAGIHVGADRVLPVGYAPAWSPNGERLAFVTRGDLWVSDADGTHQALLVRGADDPAWAPNGRRLAFTRDGWIWTVRADGLDRRRLARGAHPAWSPHGAGSRSTVAARSSPSAGSEATCGGSRPAHSRPSPATEALLSSATARSSCEAERSPGANNPRGRPTAAGWPTCGAATSTWPDAVWVAGRSPTGDPRRHVRELLPDLDQRPPTDLTIAGEPGRWLLGFTSLVDNVGLGPLMIVGTRRPDERFMPANEHVLLANGQWRTYPGVGRLVYTNAPPHHHWHLIRFDSYELRTLDGEVLVRDRKSGFCLADHYGLAPGDFERHARFLGNCAQYHPEATRVVEGTSLGFTDRYPAFFHGQNNNITGVPAGVYDLVHRTNPNMTLHELRYENDAASVRLRLDLARRRPDGARAAQLPVDRDLLS